jgi:hypothetical protein
MIFASTAFEIFPPEYFCCSRGPLVHSRGFAVFSVYNRKIIMCYSHNADGGYAGGDLLGEDRSILVKMFIEPEEAQVIRPGIL